MKKWNNEEKEGEHKGTKGMVQSSSYQPQLIMGISKLRQRSTYSALKMRIDYHAGGMAEPNTPIYVQPCVNDCHCALNAS